MISKLIFFFRKEKNLRKLRYLIIGLLAFGVDFCVFLSLAHYNLLTAQTAARLCGAVVSFLGHKYFTFQSRQFHTFFKEGLQYSLLWLVSYFISTAQIIVYIDIFGFYKPAGKFLSEAVTVVFNYVMMRYGVFNPKQSAENAAQRV